ncbi:hypothetical protein HQ545_01550 [Candidatus Woesearchaeota archaeon]|nr:hypothetical protein [Candidatus Woesearchaeota archaeon]
MAHLEIERKKYSDLLMAIASDLKVLSQMGVDKDMVKRINGELLTVGGDIKELFDKYGGYGNGKVKLGFHTHIFSGKRLVIDSEQRKQIEDAGVDKAA